MKHTLTVIAIASMLTACSTTSVNSGSPIREQKLNTSFVGEKIKIETKCAWFGMSKDCEIVAIESIGTANTFGGTANNRKQGLEVAQTNALRNVSEFLAREISTSRVQTTISKNVEKANDEFKSGVAKEEVSMTDEEANKVSLRSNDNETIIKATTEVKINSKAVLKGFVKIKEEVVGSQEVSVTVRWDKDSERAAEYLRKKFQ